MPGKGGAGVLGRLVAAGGMRRDPLGGQTLGFSYLFAGHVAHDYLDDLPAFLLAPHEIQGASLKNG